MKRICLLLAFCLTLVLPSCSGKEDKTLETTDPSLETEAEETMPDEKDEWEETETLEETQQEQTSFTDFERLTVAEGDGYYDASLGAFVVKFAEPNVRYLEDDICSVGISGDGEAYSMEGSIDLSAHSEFQNGDYYSGIVVKPAETVEKGEYTIFITFAMYMVVFHCTIG